MSLKYLALSLLIAGNCFAMDKDGKGQDQDSRLRREVALLKYQSSCDLSHRKTQSYFLDHTLINVGISGAGLALNKLAEYVDPESHTHRLLLVVGTTAEVTGGMLFLLSMHYSRRLTYDSIALHTRVDDELKSLSEERLEKE